MIGIVGAGQIVAAAHLPAYAALGLPVLAIYDAAQDRAQSLAQEWGTVCAPTLAALLDNPQVAIVDVAVPPAAGVGIIEQALRAGKHVLAQKPLAPDLAEAARLVDLAEVCRRLLVVNQQMRWSPVVKAIHSAVDDGRIGPLRWLTFDLDLPMPPGQLPGWIGKEPRFTVLLNSLHLLDTARYLLGEPSSLTATTGKCDPHLKATGETDVMVALQFAGDEAVWIVDRRNTFGDHRATFRAIGERGALRGCFGLWTNYPEGVDDQIAYAPVGTPTTWEPIPVVGRWIPNAFVGPISELIAAMSGGPLPTTSGRDHLRTLQLVEAVYQSAAAGRRIDLVS